MDVNTLKDFAYKHALVLGLAKSGTAAAMTLLRNNIDVRINDYHSKKDDDIVQQFEQLGAEVVVGSHPISVLDGIDIIVKNPGIPYSNLLLQEAIKRKIPIITEVELAAQLACKNDMIAVTGSNGKTTTTTLVYQMLVASHQRVEIAGNIGIVATEIAESLEQGTSLLVVLSSFQLMGVDTFRPHVAALLNLFDAHIDYHGTVEEYIAAKANIFHRQTKDDFLVYNAADSRVVNVIESAKAQLVPFSILHPLHDGAWVDEEFLYFKKEQIIALKDIVLVGDHNKENILAAVAIASLMGATKAGIRDVLTIFTGVEHRLQFVANKQHRLFYNDSKATNMLATEKALQSFQRPTILLAGGLDRGDDFNKLVPYLDYVKLMVVFGETTNKLEQVCKENNIVVAKVLDVEEAVYVAYEHSEPDDIILLSPACASWDQYKTFEERGNKFIQAVHTLA